MSEVRSTGVSALNVYGARFRGNSKVDVLETRYKFDNFGGGRATSEHSFRADFYQGAAESAYKRKRRNLKHVENVCCKAASIIWP